jgi:hypothetical protein
LNPRFPQALQKAIRGFHGKADHQFPEGQELASRGRRRKQFEFTKPFQNPQGAVIIQPVRRRQFSSPGVVDHDGGSKFRRLHERLNLAQVLAVCWENAVNT